MNPQEIIDQAMSQLRLTPEQQRQQEALKNDKTAQQRIEEENHAIWLGMDVTKKKLDFLDKSRLQAIAEAQKESQKRDANESYIKIQMLKSILIESLILVMKGEYEGSRLNVK